MDFRAFHQFQARLERIAQRFRPRKNRRRSPRRYEPRYLPATRSSGDLVMRFPTFIAPREESEASLLRASLRHSASLCVSALSFSPLFRLLNEFRARCSRRLPRPGRRVSFFSCFQLSTFNFQPSISCAALRLQRLPRPDQGVSFFPSFQLSTL